MVKTKAEYQKEWRRKNKERIKEYQKKWKKEHPQNVKESSKRHYQKHKEKIAKYLKEYLTEYEKTKKGFLMRKYRNMQSRVVGIQKKKAHLYKGKCLLERDEYYKWAFDSREFNRLYEEWVKSEYDRKLCPTVDRINPDEGYCLENMRWITHSENSRLGAVARNKK